MPISMQFPNLPEWTPARNPVAELNQSLQEANKTMQQAVAESKARNMQKAQQLLVQRMQSDPGFASRIGQNVGLVFPAITPQAQSGLVETMYKQSAQDARDQAKLAQQKNRPNATGPALNLLQAAFKSNNPAYIASAMGMIEQMGLKITPEQMQAAMDSAIQAQANAGTMQFQQVPGQPGVVIPTMGNKMGAAIRPTQVQPTHPESSAFDYLVNQRGMTPDQAYNTLKNYSDKPEALKYMFDKQGNLLIIDPSKMRGGEGATTPTPTPPTSVPEVPVEPGAPSIPDASGISTAKLPPGITSIPLGGTATANPEELTKEETKVVDNVASAINSSPAWKTLNTARNAEFNRRANEDYIGQLMYQSEKDPDPAKREAAKNKLFYAKNIQGIGVLYNYMNTRDGSVVKEGELRLIQSAIPNMPRNKAITVMEDIRRWMNNETTMLNPDATKVFQALQNNYLQLITGALRDDILSNLQSMKNVVNKKKAYNLVMAQLKSAGIFSEPEKQSVISGIMSGENVRVTPDTSSAAAPSLAPSTARSGADLATEFFKSIKTGTGGL